MQSISWAALLRHFPLTMQEGLVLKTLGGTEIAVQTILRIDHEFFAIKGRLAGTQEMGRFFFIPYSQIDHLGYQKELMEAEFKAIFDTLTMPSSEVAFVASAPVVVEEPPPASVPPTVEPSDVAADAPGNRGAPVPLKSAVLERFRSRSGSHSGIGPRPSQG